MNRDIDKFATNVRNIRFFDYFDSWWIVQTVCGLSGQFVDCPDSFWIVRTVSGLSGQFLVCPDSF